MMAAGLKSQEFDDLWLMPDNAATNGRRGCRMGPRCGSSAAFMPSPLASSLPLFQVFPQTLPRDIIQYHTKGGKFLLPGIIGIHSPKTYTRLISCDIARNLLLLDAQKKIYFNSFPIY
jgi:hypothetical protein